MSAVYLIASLLLCLIVQARSADLAHAATECSSAQGSRNAYWSWREIDGRRCWYVGRPGRSKEQLRWPLRAREEAQPTSEAARPTSGLQESGAEPLPIRVPLVGDGRSWPPQPWWYEPTVIEQQRPWPKK